MEDNTTSPNRELYMAYIGYLESDALKELDPNSARYKILAVIVQIAGEHNIFNSVSAMPILYGIAAKFKDEFTD
jgi:hypothetical protein